MSRFSALLVCLMLLLSLGLGSVAHASEGVTCSGNAAASSVEHSDGDADQVPADADKAYPHHHDGCHGHHAAVPIATDQAAPVITQRIRLVVWNNAPKLPSASDPALRPPQA